MGHELSYEILMDRSRQRLIVNIVGAFSVDETASFGKAVRTAVVQVKGGGTSFDMLVDLAAAALMSQAVSTESKGLLAWCVANGLRRSANVTSSALAKLQVQRVSGSDLFRMFATREEAIDWLDEPDHPQA